MQIEQERFEAWLMAQPPERRFRWFCPQGCAVNTFLTETTQLSFVSSGTTNSVYRVKQFDPLVEVQWPVWLCKTVHPVVHDMTAGNLQKQYRKVVKTHPVRATPAVPAQPRRNIMARVAALFGFVA